VCVMVQKEVGDRLCAEVGSREYGSLTVGVGLNCEMALVFDLDENSFQPRPRVLSSVVHLKRRQTPLTNEIERTQKVIQAAFQQRRKTIFNSLSHGLHLSKDIIGAWLDSLEIPRTNRAQNLTPQQFIKISDLLGESTGK